MTSLLQKINELNVRVDNVSTSGGGGTTDTTAIQAQVDTNTTDISGIQTSKQNTLIAGDNITISGDTISASGGGSGTTIDSNSDLSVKTITTTGDANFGGRLISANQKMFINNTIKDLEGLTSYNLVMNEEWLTSSFVRHSNGLFTFQNLPELSLFIVTVLVGVESDVYNARVNWRLTPFLNNSNFSGYGQFYTTTEGSASINRYSTLMVRTLVGAQNNQVYRLNVDCNKEGDNTFGSSMNGLRIRNAPIVTFEYVGPFIGQKYTTS